MARWKLIERLIDEIMEKRALEKKKELRST